MAYEYMARVAFNFENPNTGAIYHNTVDVGDGLTSKDYILPKQEVTHIGVILSGAGTGEIQFTIDPPEIIEAGTASFLAWDGVSQINPAVTGFRVVSSSGAIQAKVTVRTADM